MTTIRPTGRAGVYVHVPWCLRRCPYCDFTVAVQRSIPHEAWADAILAEWSLRRPLLGGSRLRSLYFGGGTPALWAPDQLLRVVDAVAADPRAALEEVTVEANPECWTQAQARTLRQGGVTRVSLGAQSLHEGTLRTLGRTHQASEVLRSLEACERAGYAHVSIDLIFGVPGAPAGQVGRDVAAVAGWVDHVSAYELTWEPGTALDQRRRRGQLRPPPEDRVLEEAASLRQALHQAGLTRYEVSSWSRPGAHSVHNHGYWFGDAWLGLGVGAHSMWHEGGLVHRAANHSHTGRYMAEPWSARAWEEAVGAREHLAELLMTGVRTVEGIDVEAQCRRLGLAWDASCRAMVERWRVLGWVDLAGPRVQPTESGLDMADSMAADAFKMLASDGASGL